MTKPKPEQFGLTSDLVRSLLAERARRDKFRESLCTVPCIGLCVVGGIASYVLNLPWKGSLSIFQLLGLLLTVGWIIGLGFGVGLIVGFFILRVIKALVPDPPRFKALTCYLDSVAQYDAWFLRTQEDFWEGLTGRRFEIEVSNLLNHAGYQARLTPASGDGGVDIVLGDGTIVQCKAHRAPTSPGVVRELYGALIHQNAPKAMLISLSGVTKGVHEFIKGKPIVLWDRSDLIALQKSLDDA